MPHPPLGFMGASARARHDWIGVQQLELTQSERIYLFGLRAKLEKLKGILNDQPLPVTGELVDEWFAYLSQISDIMGNFSNGVSFAATLMAKAYLLERLPLIAFDAAGKAMGAPGLDIDTETSTGQRVIGEIKTTVPYGTNDLGAQQRASFQGDFAKLNKNQAAHKYFFVTNEQTFELMQQKYAQHIPGVMVVLLPTGKEYCAPYSGSARPSMR